MDRVAAYPAILWLLLAGTAMIVRNVPDRETSGAAAGRVPLPR
jgi:hypothetical protein